MWALLSRTATRGTAQVCYDTTSSSKDTTTPRVSPPTTAEDTSGGGGMVDAERAGMDVGTNCVDTKVSSIVTVLDYRPNLDGQAMGQWGTQMSVEPPNVC